MSIFRVPLIALVVVTGGCGGNQPPAARAVDTEAEAGCCLEVRWDEPPENIGQTPPPTEAPEDALEPFRPDP